jgi:RNA polymerase sigma-70 factor (ECF subfamily)
MRGDDKQQLDEFSYVRDEQRIPIQIETWPQTIEEFERLIEATQDDLVNFAFHRLGNQDDAEDAVQDIYVQAFRDRTKRRHITEIRPYLFRMTGNRCIDLVRARVRRPAEPLTDTVAAGESTFLLVAAREQTSTLLRLLEDIPEREAEVIRLRAFSDLSFAEVAAIVGTSVSTVKSRFRYGVDKLRRVLCPEGETR